jgi:hypothetical protein
MVRAKKNLTGEEIEKIADEVYKRITNKKYLAEKYDLYPEEDRWRQPIVPTKIIEKEIKEALQRRGIPPTRKNTHKIDEWLAGYY